jgi:exodeoxyribonuclease X
MADFDRKFLPADFAKYWVAPTRWRCASGLTCRRTRNQFLRYHLELPIIQTNAMPPHRAAPDAYVCAVLMNRIMETDRDKLDEMVRWSSGPALLPRINFGKHRGAKWEDVPLDYLDWVANKSDLGRDEKANARHHLKLRSSHD